MAELHFAFPMGTPEEGDFASKAEYIEYENGTSLKSKIDEKVDKSQFSALPFGGIVEDVTITTGTLPQTPDAESIFFDKTKGYFVARVWVIPEPTLGGSSQVGTSLTKFYKAWNGSDKYNKVTDSGIVPACNSFIDITTLSSEEIESLLNAKADQSEVDDIASQISGLSTSKADKSTTYTKTEVDSKIKVLYDYDEEEEYRDGTLFFLNNTYYILKVKTTTQRDFIPSSYEEYPDLSGDGVVNTLDWQIGSMKARNAELDSVGLKLNTWYHESYVNNYIKFSHELYPIADKDDLDLKADKSTTYTKTEVDSKIGDIGEEFNRVDDDINEVANGDYGQPDYEALPLLCGQPPILFGAGTPQEAVVPTNWKKFADGGYNWNGLPSAIGQVYINTSATSNGRYTAYQKADGTLAWLNF